MTVAETAAQINAAAFNLRGQPVFDGILHQRLQQHARDHDIERSGIEFLHYPQLVLSETYDFNVQIVVDEFHFFAQRYEGFAAVQQAPQDVRQLDDHLARRIWIETYQRRNRIQGVKEEMRVDLVLQRLHTRVQKQALLLLQLDLRAYA